jgi:hypothetical protein
MAYSVWFQLYAISYQPYANYARLASEIFLSSLQSDFFSNLLGQSRIGSAGDLRGGFLPRGKRSRILLA